MLLTPVRRRDEVQRGDMRWQVRLTELQAGVKQLRGERDGAVKALRRTKLFKEEQASKLTELSVGFESMVQVR